jgi:hypothetical protein
VDSPDDAMVLCTCDQTMIFSTHEQCLIIGNKVHSKPTKYIFVVAE